MKKLLQRINSDIDFLSSRKSFSFGGRKKIQSAIDTGIIHTICSIPIHIYYYNVKNTIIYTPYQKNTTQSTSFEGPYHPVCKIEIDRYKDYVFTEDGIKYKGNTEIFSMDNLENNDPNFYNDEMMLAMLFACFYSLKKRLEKYVYIINNLDGIIDYGHNIAPRIYFKKIQMIFKLFKISLIKNCAHKFIYDSADINLKQMMQLFEQIKCFSSDKSPERKQFIIDYYNSIINKTPFNTPIPPCTPKEPKPSSRKLFRDL